MPNKFLIETALDVGIANLEKSRNTDPKKLYEEVKISIKSESSDEIRWLYQKYIDLYDVFTKYSTSKSAALSEEVKWKNISDVRKAVWNNGVWLSLSEKEWLNQFALAEYSRQSHKIGEASWDIEVLELLKKWFRIYERVLTQSSSWSMVLQHEWLSQWGIIMSRVSLANIQDNIPRMSSSSLPATESPHQTLESVKLDKEIPIKKPVWASVVNTKDNTSIARDVSVNNKPQLKLDWSDVFTIKESVVFKDGKYYLTGPKGAMRQVEQSELLLKLNIPKNAPENLQKSVSIVQDFSLILDAFLMKNPKEKGTYEYAVNKLAFLYKNDDIQLGKTILDVTSITQNIFSNNNFLKNSDLFKIDNIFQITDAVSRHTAVLEFIRKTLEQSDMVLEILIAKNTTALSIPRDEAILNGDLSSTWLTWDELKKVNKVRDTARGDANTNWMKNKDTYIKSFQAQNPWKTVDTEAARIWNEKLTIVAMTKREIVYQKLYGKTGLSPELSMAQDIMWATRFGVSDKASEISSEIAQMIAIEAIAIAAGAVTAGAGTIAVNALMLGRNATRWIHALEAYNAASVGRKFTTTASRILVGGGLFELAHANAVWQIEWTGWTLGTKEWYAQSIAMIGVMGGLGKLFEKTGFLAAKEWAGIGKNMPKLVWQTLIEGTAIFGTTWLVGGVMFDHRDNWTLEQMAQAILMAAIFKWVTGARYLARKNNQGNVEVIHETSTRNAQKADFTVDASGTAVPTKPSTNKNTRKRGNIDPELIAKNQSYDDDATRIQEACNRLQRSFSQEQANALSKAHNTEGVMQKWRILAREWKFSKEEVRILMEEWYAGRRRWVEPWVSTEPPTGSRTETSSINRANLDITIEKAAKNLKKEWDEINIGWYTITKEKSGYRVKRGDEEFVWQSEAMMLSRVKNGIAQDASIAQTSIDSAIKENISRLPSGKSRYFTWNGDKYTLRKNTKWNDVEVIGPGGKVLKWDELKSFYDGQATQLLEMQTKNFLSRFWKEKAFHDHAQMDMVVTPSVDE